MSTGTHLFPYNSGWYRSRSSLGASVVVPSSTNWSPVAAETSATAAWTSPSDPAGVLRANHVVHGPAGIVRHEFLRLDGWLHQQEGGRRGSGWGRTERDVAGLDAAWRYVSTGQVRQCNG
ncbi:hypothetical protein [Arthrobacter cheniae]|uniref:hypothetical protein n=1 Tax=Arthrobacter cheniae TaxID=1258888 RepID=UPI001F291E0A|nr:hypothetical protein [Arthrobacter cheniae]